MGTSLLLASFTKQMPISIGGQDLFSFLDETPPANAGGIILVQAKLAPYLRALGVQCNVVSLPR